MDACQYELSLLSKCEPKAFRCRRLECSTSTLLANGLELWACDMRRIGQPVLQFG